jgi:cytochrome P450
MAGDLVPQAVLSPEEASARETRFPVGASITFDDLTEHARIGALDRLRDAEPVSWVPALGGWLVTSWDLARSVLGRRDRFSVWAEPNLVRASLGVMMLTSDGDSHARQRAPFDAPFRMRAVRDRFQQPIEARTSSLIAELAPAGSCELGQAFAGPFAVEVAADVLGLGLGNVGRIMGFYHAFAGAMVYDGDPEPQRLADAARAELNEILHAELARVRATPDDSITSAVANTPGDLDDDEIAAQLRVVLFGAIETIESLVLNTTAMLLAHPDQLALVRARPELLPNAIEESMRLVTPVAFMERWTTMPDTELGDVLLGRGEFVGVSSLAASRDPAVFPDPARFDVTRDNARRHLSFSYGEHHCLGFHLARLQGAVAIQALFDKLPGLRLVSAAEPVGFAFRKVPELQIAWE